MIREYLTRKANPIKEYCECGVYLFFMGDEVVYAGKSVCINDRIANHLRSKKKDFDSYTFVLVQEEYLDLIEAAFILSLRPKHNMKAPDYVGLSLLALECGLPRDALWFFQSGWRTNRFNFKSIPEIDMYLERIMESLFDSSKPFDISDGHITFEERTQ